MAGSKRHKADTTHSIKLSDKITDYLMRYIFYHYSLNHLQDLISKPSLVISCNGFLN